MATMTLRFGGYQEPASIHNQSATFFGERLRVHLGDKVRLELIGSVLKLGRNSGDLPIMVESGELDFCYMATVRFARSVPDLKIFELPFVVGRREAAHAAMRGALGSRVAEQLERATPFKLLGLWDNGFRYFSNKLHPIRTPADCKGLRIRIQMSELIAESLAALGFEPIAVDIKEFVEQVAGERFDAQENPLTNIYNFGVHKHHRYITLSGHIFGAAAFICNRARYEAWPANVRGAIDRAAREATEHQYRLAALEDDAVMAKLDPAQNEVVRLSPSEHAAFVAAVQPVVERHRGSIDPKLFEWLKG